MRRPDVVAKVRAWSASHVDERRALSALAQAAIDRKRPSGLERRLHGILDGLGVAYDIGVVMKPHFVVDVRIGSLIIEADGDYWHGHPRLAPLTERQLAQQKRDRARDAYLTACGYKVVRIWESDMSEGTVRAALVEAGVMLPAAA